MEQRGKKIIKVKWSNTELENTDYVQALRVERNSVRNGAIIYILSVYSPFSDRVGLPTSMRLHTTVVSHQRTPDICWNALSLHISALWMTFYSSTKQRQCVEQWKSAVW